MPKIAKQLSDRAVAALKAEGRHAVGGVAGLHLRVSAGHRGWVLRVKVGDARKDIGLGAYPVVSLAEARERAWKIHESIREGHAPVAPRRQQRQALLAQAATEKPSAGAQKNSSRPSPPSGKMPSIASNGKTPSRLMPCPLSRTSPSL